MAAYGHHVDSVDGMLFSAIFEMNRLTCASTGNDILKWSITGAPAKAVIALAYIFVGVCTYYWVSSHSGLQGR